MKKLLTILGSLGVAATAAAGVVACGTQADDKFTPNATVEANVVTFEKDGIKLDKDTTVTNKAKDADVKALFVLKDGDGEQAKPIDITLATFTAKEGQADDATVIEGKLTVKFAAPAAKADAQNVTYELGMAKADAKTKVNESIKFTIAADPKLAPTLAEKATTTDNTVFAIATTNIADAEDVKANVTVAGLPNGTSVKSAAVKSNVLTITLDKAIAQTDKEQSFKVTYKNGDKTLSSSLVVAKKAEEPKTVTLKDAKWVDATHVTVATTNVADGAVAGVTITDTAKESPVTVTVKSATEANGTLTIELDGAGIAQTDKEQKFTITVNGVTADLTVAAKAA